MPAAADLDDAYLAQRRRIERAALRVLGCPAAAADIAQETWLRAAAASEPARDPVGLLRRIARNLVLDRLRRRRHDTLPLEDTGAHHLPDATPGPERVFADRQALACVQAAIADLPPRCREAFLLARLDGLSHTAIAARMGVSPRTVENHVALALLRLRQAVRDAG